MGEDPHRWILTNAAEPMTPADPAHKPGAEEVVVAVDACSLWRRNVGFVFGADHGGADASDLLRRIDGHVVEAGEDALFWVDRTVALSGAVPCGRHEDCWTGKIAECPHRKTAATGEGADGVSVVAPAREVRDAERSRAGARVIGLDPFKDG